MSRMFVHWWEDSSRRVTCHRNERGLTAAESFLGEVKGCDLDGWYYRLANSEEWVGPIKYGMDVRRALEKAVGGVQINAND